MSGFGRNQAVDSGGFRGLVPENSTIPVVIIEGDASLVKIKKGKNAGKTARVFKPVFECIAGKYRGARVYSDVWCNVEPDPAGGEPDVFGSHMLFCDICDICEVKEEDGSYPIATNEDAAKEIVNRFVGRMMFVTVGTETYSKRDGSEGSKNTLKNVSTMNGDQLEQMREGAAATLERVAKQKAKKEAQAGGSGLPDDDDDDDMPF